MSLLGKEHVYGNEETKMDLWNLSGLGVPNLLRKGEGLFAEGYGNAYGRDLDIKSAG